MPEIVHKLVAPMLRGKGEPSRLGFWILCREQITTDTYVSTEIASVTCRLCRAIEGKNTYGRD